jgi:phosphate-selective porin OprO and OprP
MHGGLGSSGRSGGPSLFLIAAWLAAVSPWVSAQAPSGIEAAPPPSARPAETGDEVRRRLQALEETNKKILEEFKAVAEQNRRLMEQNSQLQKGYDELSRTVEGLKSRPAGGTTDGATSSRPGTPGSQPDDAEQGRPAEGRDGGVDQPLTAVQPGVKNRGKIPIKGSYDWGRNGFLWESEDEEFQLRVRAEVQADARFFSKENLAVVNSGFYIPRARLYFSGRMTRPIEYQLSIARSFGSLDILDAFVNFRYDDRYQLRFGRFKTPYTYEFYKLHNWELLAPERSLFNVNFALNRQVGVMG